MDVYNSLVLAHDKGRYLFETRPDLFPQGFETPIERALWARFYNDLNESRKKNG